MNLSPWFKPSEPPVRDGVYQVKGWDGQIHDTEWTQGEWWDGVTPIPQKRICAWRGLSGGGKVE